MAATIEHLDPWIGGRDNAVAGRAVYELVSPVDGKVASEIVDSDADVTDAAVTDAHRAFTANRRATAATRADWLNGAATEIEAAKDDIVRALMRDIGKPKRPAAFEATRSAQFVRLVTAELGHMGGETLPLGLLFGTPAGVVSDSLDF